MADKSSISKCIVTLQINDRINITQFYIKIHLENSGFDLKKEIEFEHEGLSANNIRLIFSGRVVSDDFSLFHQGIKHGSIIFLIAKKISNRRVTPSMQMSRLSELIDRYYTLFNGRISKFPSRVATKNYYSNSNDSAQANDLRSIINEISDIITNPIVKASARIYSEFQMKIEEAYEIVQSGNSLQNGLYGNNIYFSSLTQKNVLFAARTHDIAFDQVESTPEGFRLLQSIVKEIELNSINGPIHNNESFFASSLHPNSSSASSWYGKGKKKTNLNYKSEISTKPLPQCWCRPSSLVTASPTYFMGSKPSLIMTRAAIPSNCIKSNRTNNFYQATSKFNNEFNQIKNTNQRSNKVDESISDQNKSELQSPENNSNRNNEISDNANNESPSINFTRSLSITQSKSNKHTNTSAASADSTSIFGFPLCQKEKVHKSGKSDDSDYAECNASTDDEERNDVKEKFALQLDTLKSMGFSDDETILRALMEADGNVQLAVRILKQNRISSVK